MTNPTLHSHTHYQAAPADPQAKTWRQRVSVPTRNRQKIRTKEEHRTHNSGNRCTTPFFRK